MGRGGSALALASLLLAAATPADARARHVRRSHVASARPLEDIGGFGAFTPAAADPRLAAAFARSGLGTPNFAGGAFRFTPSGTPSTRAVTVAVRARVVSRAEAAHNLSVATDLAPSAYSLGASVGWKRFTIAGDVAKTTNGLLPEGHESADIGLSFSGHRWATKVDLAADRASGDHPAMVGVDQSWSLGLGGTYALGRNFDVTGGVRYKAQRDQLFSIADDRRDSQAVYLGTTFRF